MVDRQIVLDETEELSTDEQLRQAQEKVKRAEQELAELKHRAVVPAGTTASQMVIQAQAETELRKDSMMAHLLDSLAKGKDIGHYGRLVFAMVARHFMPHEAVLAWLVRDPDFREDQANLMLRQVEGKDYNPPRRDRIVEWQAQQEFPILPHPDDPDCGNLYRNLKFPEAIYEHIGHYQEQKAATDDAG